MKNPFEIHVHKYSLKTKSSNDSELIDSFSELIPKFDRRLQSSPRVLPLYRTPPPIEQKTESVEDHARLSKIIEGSD